MTAVASTFESDNPIVQKLIAGSAPDPIRLAAARGALPIAPEELLSVLYLLRADDNAEVVVAVKKTLRELDDVLLSAHLKSQLVPAEVLDFFAQECVGRETVAQALVANKTTTDQTLAFLAGAVTGTALELLVTNQIALIRSPALLDALLGNPRISSDQRRRVEEVREEFVHKRDREDKRRAATEARLAELRTKEAWTQAELEKLQEDLTKEVLAEREAGLDGDVDEPTPAEDDEATESASQRILKMSVPEKVLAAIRGSRTERFILIRDSNRLVANSVIRSPKVSDSEVEQYAGMRNVVDDILRFIGNKREWVRNYPVLLTLVKNPRTPIAVALNLLPRVQARDLKNLTGDRNVAEVLRRQAKMIMDKAVKR